MPRHGALIRQRYAARWRFACLRYATRYAAAIRYCRLRFDAVAAERIDATYAILRVTCRRHFRHDADAAATMLPAMPRRRYAASLDDAAMPCFSMLIAASATLLRHPPHDERRH